MEQPVDKLRESRLMGEWVLEMQDADQAQVTIASLPPALRAAIEVRKSIWGAEVRTGDEDAVQWLKAHYRPTAHTLVA
jgi:hypothetical protein